MEPGRLFSKTKMFLHTDQNSTSPESDILLIFHQLKNFSDFSKCQHLSILLYDLEKKINGTLFLQ